MARVTWTVIGALAAGAAIAGAIAGTITTFSVAVAITMAAWIGGDLAGGR